jgi:hypothetical protein
MIVINYTEFQIEFGEIDFVHPCSKFIGRHRFVEEISTSLQTRDHFTVL